jgi:radical SAM superfamily enzyme YgiQ (UPF0313 family)
VRVVLIHPPWLQVYGKYREAARVGVLYPPLGLCSLAAYLETGGHEIRIIDAEAEGLDTTQVVERIDAAHPDMVGITATTPMMPGTEVLAKEINDRLNIPVVLGGPHVTAMPLETLRRCQHFDYGVYGEGEETFLDLVNHLEKGGEVKGIKGLVYREKGEVVKTELRPLLKDLDALPFPDRGLLTLENYRWSVPKKGTTKFTTIMSTRGCPFHCVFCSQSTVFGREVRYRSPENVLDEMEEIVENFGVRHLVFIDDTLTLKRQRVVEICRGILERGLEVTWEGWTRAHTVDEELLRLMKKAGLVRISFGIESGNPRILKAIKKGVSLEAIKRAYRMAKRVGLETRGSVMLGHPFETRQTAIETLEFIRSLEECDQVHINIMTPYPGTELYRMIERGEGGIRLLTDDFSEYRRYGDAVIEVNDLKREDLIGLQKRGFLMFYLTPKRIVYNLRRAGLRAGLKNALAFLRSIAS